MLCTVLTSSRSKGIGDGLTYDAGDLRVCPGMLVRVPLRKGMVEGIVIETDVPKPAFAVRKIDAVLSPEPLLHAAQLAALQWMGRTYNCPLRKVLSVFLPQGKWGKLLLPVPPLPYPLPLKGAREEKSGEETRVLLLGTRIQRMAVYEERVRKTLQEGRQVIMLVSNVSAQRGQVPWTRVPVPVFLHSDMTTKEQRETWSTIRSGRVRLVIGSRKALFAPCGNLGLVIIDDEKDRAYESEQTPKYNVRDVAQVLCRHAHADLILGAFAPSVAAWLGVREGRYALQHCSDASMLRPDIRIIDLRGPRGTAFPLSAPLLEALKERLARKERCVLFLGKKGAEGTEKIEAMLRMFFPQARVLRIEAGKVPARGTGPLDEGTCPLHANADIIIGTQAALPLLDNPQVRFAAILLADIGLSAPGVDAGERVYHFLSSVCEAMQGKPGGAVMLQTMRPDAPEVRAVAEQSPALYLDAEIGQRWAMRLSRVEAAT